MPPKGRTVSPSRRSGMLWRRCRRDVVLGHAGVVARRARIGQSVRVKYASNGAPGEQASLARAFVLGLGAGLALAVGALLIYGFGAGYFGASQFPTPLNFVVAPMLLLGLMVVLWRFLVRRLPTE